MHLGTVITILTGLLLFIGGGGLGRSLLKRGATAQDLFKGRNPVSLAFLGLYVGLMVVILNVPQMGVLPLEWRFHGLRITWGLMQIFLAGMCGLALTISWHTARSQVLAIALVSVLGLGAFSGAQSYFLSPIHASLNDNLQPNGVFKQTSSSSCAPAALATVLRQWGIPATESGVAQLAGTSRMGTSMPQLIVAAKEMNLDGLELRPTWELMQQINRPGVLAFWLIDEGRYLPHAVALLGLNDAIATIADPSTGKIFDLDRRTFDIVWRHQYVPIYRPDEVLLSPIEASLYLRQLSYLQTWKSGDNLAPAIRQFQQDHHLKENGKLNAETALALSGPFLKDSPRLDADLNLYRYPSS